MTGSSPDSLESIGPSLAPGRVVGLDLGTTTIGVAISDVTRKIASPLDTLARTRFQHDAGRLLDLVKREAAVAIVIGLPINMDGTEGPRAQSTRAFARNLAKVAPVPIVFWDERLSTAAVDRMLIDADTSRTKRQAVVDKLAAAYILQGALDRLSRID